MAYTHPFFLVVFLLLASNSYGSTISLMYNQNILRAHQEYLKLKISSGNDFASQAVKLDSRNAVGHLISNYSDFLTLCIKQDPSEYDKLILNQERRFEIIEGIKEKSAWRDFALAEVKMQIGISKLLFGNKLSASWDIRQAYLQYVTNSKKHPNFIPNKKTLGVLQVLIGSVPDNYRWFLNIIGMKGDVDTGLYNLRTAATKENPFQEESQLLYALILQLVDQKQESQALKIIEKLTEQEPDNLLYRFTAIHLFKKTKNTDQALKYYLKRPQGNMYLSFPYLHHMAADMYLNSGNYDASIRENQLFLKLHKGEHYVKAAHFKLYLAYLLDNHSPQALWYYNKINQVGISEIEEDKYAAKFVEKREQPEKNLLIARLRTDGGYYKQALKALDGVDTTRSAPISVRGEYLYRKARIYHGMEEEELAVKYYKETIEVCGSSDLYFAPNAALQLGYIHQLQNRKELAKYYFKKAQTYHGHEYKSSIDAKAKLALSAL
jgi:hypothetical protein